MTRSHRTLTWRTLAVALALVVVAGACSGDDDQGVASPGGNTSTETGGGSDGGTSGDTGRLVVAIASPVRKLDFVGILDTSAFAAFQTNVLEGLTRTQFDGDGNLEWVPALAESWEREGPLQWRFTLRDDVTFHNGAPFTSADVVFTVVKITADDAEVGVLLGNIERAEVVDEHTVDIFTKQPTEFLDRAVAGLTIQPDGWGVDDPAAALSELPGTGPYRLADFGRGEDILLELNDDYWGDNDGAFQEVQIRTIPEAGARLAALQTGEIDVAFQLSPDLATAAPQTLTTTGAEVEFFRMSNQGDLMSDVRVRQALNMAVDRDTLINSIRGGFAQAPHSQQIPPDTFGYNDELEDYPYDVDEAKRLIDEAGATGKTVTMVCTSDTYGDIGRDSCATVAQMVEDTGLVVDLAMLPKDDYITQFFSKQNGLPLPDLVYIVSGTDTLTADTPMWVWFDCENGRNAFCDPDVEAAVQAAAALPIDAQETAWHELMAELKEKAAQLWLTVPEVVIGTVEGVEGPVFPLTGTNGDSDWARWRRTEG